MTGKLQTGRGAPASCTRRALLGGATAAALIRPGPSIAEIALGQSRIQTVSDGNLVLPADFVLGPVPKDTQAALRAEFGLTGDTLSPPCNVTLMRSGTRVVLFDAGAGSGFQPSAGTLTASLEAVGLAPEDVTDVVFTHAHPDHLWGVLDDFDEPLFVNAQHHIGRVEFDYWMDPATAETIDAARQSFAVGAARRLALLAERMAFFEAGESVLPGVTAVASFGHTPGHMGFLLEDDGAAVFVAGDALSNDHLAFAFPATPSGSDQDLDAAAATRVDLLDRLVTDDLPLIGFHLSGGGIGRAVRAQGAYRFRPDTG